MYGHNYMQLLQQISSCLTGGEPTKQYSVVIAAKFDKFVEQKGGSASKCFLNQ